MLTAGACQLRKNQNVEYVPESMYDLKVLYDSSDYSFYLTLTSVSKQDICIPKMVWPDAKGRHYLFGDSQVFMMDQGVKYEIQDAENGYCQSSKKNGCVYEIKNGASLLGKLKLEDFNISNTDLKNVSAPKLEYPYRPFFCSQ